MNNQEELKILIVEDNKMYAALLSETIGSRYKKTISYTGKDALDIYNVVEHDMIFLDIRLPDMNGYEVLENIKSKGKDIYVVVVTGDKTEDNVKKAIDNKVKGFLGKPFSRDKIVEHLERASAYFDKGV